MEFVELEKREFENIERDLPISNYCQTTKWACLKELTGWKSYYVAVREKNKYLCGAVILSKKVFGKYNICYAPRGILVNYEDYHVVSFFTKNIKEYIKKHHGIFLKIDPFVSYISRDKDALAISSAKDNIVKSLKYLGYKHHGFTKGFYTNEIQYRWSYYLDIKKTLEETFKDMNSRCKRCLKKASKYPLIVKDVDESNIKEFKKIMEHTCNRHNCFDRSLEYYMKIKECFKEEVLMKIIYLDKNKYLENFKEDKNSEVIKKDKRDLIPLSSGVFIRDKNFLHYVYGGTYSQYMCFMAQYKMQADMIKYAIKEEIPIYDFGGISGCFVRGTENYGIYEFKRGFGGYVVEYIGEFNLVIRPLLNISFKFCFRMYSKFKSLVAHYMKK